MIKSPLLSYGFSHHLFHQAAQLAPRVTGYRMATSSFVSPHLIASLRSWAPRLARSLARRSHPEVPYSVARAYPVEHVYQLAARVSGRSYSYFAAHDRMARRIVRDFAPPSVLIAIDTGAESLFRAWKGRTRCVLDLSIAVPQFRAKIFTDAESNPAHAGVSFHHPGKWELTRYAAEVALADVILCPSEFVMDSCRFIGAPKEKLRLLPYGFDPGRFSAPSQPRPIDQPLRVVFAGTFNHRKGSHLVLEAFARLRTTHPNAELHVFGDVQDAPAPRATSDGVQFHGRVPQEVLAERFREMDIMAFPSLFEGSAYVIYQALASGVPVITTRNSGSVVDTTCGVILPEISASALHDALSRFAKDRIALARLAAAAPACAARYTWNHYGQGLHTILSDTCPSLLL
jgi:glycosyltransferase involved in cell wall biosynthesis